MDNENLDLLEFLQYIIGCTHISDLRSDSCNDRTKMLFKNLNLTKWSLNQIIDAINYIFK